MATNAAFIALVFLCICTILLGAVSTSPVRWVIVACGAIALVLVAAGGLSINLGVPR